MDVAANGVEAVDAVRNRPYDLILMDIGMPEMDGVEATAAIRALGGTKARVPIVALTAHVMRGDRENLLAQGLDDYLAKPIERPELIRCLTHWLGIPGKCAGAASGTAGLRQSAIGAHAADG